MAKLTLMLGTFALGLGIALHFAMNAVRLVGAGIMIVGAIKAAPFLECGVQKNTVPVINVLHVL